MGMSIKQSLDEIDIMLIRTKDLGFHEAIRTLRDKYQKIQEIVNRSDDFIYRNAEYRLQEIKEVLEDGKIG